MAFKRPSRVRSPAFRSSVLSLEGLLDGFEIGAVRRQVEQLGLLRGRARRANGDAVVLDQGAADLLKRQIWLMGNQRQHGFAIFSQARVAIAAHGPGLSMALSLQTLRHPDRRADVDPEPVRGLMSKHEDKTQ
jgi:hypothetical protein